MAKKCGSNDPKLLDGLKKAVRKHKPVLRPSSQANDTNEGRGRGRGRNLSRDAGRGTRRGRRPGSKRGGEQ